MQIPGALRFTDRVAIISGSSTSLGGEIANRLAERGVTVVRADEDVNAERMTAAAAKSMVAGCVGRSGRLDAVISANVVEDRQPLMDAPIDRFAAAWHAVVTCPFHLSQAALPQLRRQNFGRIVLIGSASGLLYAHHGEGAIQDVAMGAIAGMTRALASEAPSTGVQVNMLLPVPDEWERAGQAGTSAPEPPDSTAVAAAIWLAHSKCEVNGRFFAAGRGRIAEVFTSAGRGFQSSTPEVFSIEDVRDGWATARSRTGSISPADQREYHAFRVQVYNATVAR